MNELSKKSGVSARSAHIKPKSGNLAEGHLSGPQEKALPPGDRVVKERAGERIKFDLLIHDFKVPLAVVEAGLDALVGRPEKYGPLTPAQTLVIKRVRRNIKVIQTLVNDALELGRSEAGVMNPVRFRLPQLVLGAMAEMFDIADGNFSERISACDDLSSMRNLLGRHGVVLLVDDALWHETIFLDESKIRQILRNLLNNAFKYRKDKVELGFEKQGDTLLISVADDGEGIPSVFHEKIFESYFQIDSEEICSVRGHGLGLAGVMVLVEDMKCKLSLESERGRGARFTVRVPLDGCRSEAPE